MGLVITSGDPLQNFDETVAAASVAASTTSTLKTISGKGSAVIAIAGDGTSQVNMKVTIDGGAPTTIGAADIKSVSAFKFDTSLVLSATNTDAGGAHNHSGVSATGTGTAIVVT